MNHTISHPDPREHDTPWCLAFLQKTTSLTAHSMRSHWPYPSHYDLILREGQVFHTRPWPADITSGRPKACFRNASLLALQDPSRFAYCEGIAKGLQGLPFYHGWAIDRDGYVVDNTWLDCSGEEYLGIVLRLDYVFEILTRQGEDGVLDAYKLKWPLCSGAHPLSRAVLDVESWRATGEQPAALTGVQKAFGRVHHGKVSEWIGDFHLYRCDVGPRGLSIAKQGGNTYHFDSRGECECQGKMWMRLKHRNEDCRHEAMARVFLTLQCPTHGICAYLPAQWEIREYHKDGYAALLICRICEATKGYGHGTARPLFPAQASLLCACLKNIADHASFSASLSTQNRYARTARPLGRMRVPA